MSEITSITGKSPNVAKSLIFSLLVCLVGAALFGVVYNFGYYAYIIPILQVMLAMTVYINHAKLSNKNITISAIWCIVWSIALNIISIIVAETIYIVNEFTTDFGTALMTLYDLYLNFADIRNAIHSTIITVSAITLIFGIIAVANVLRTIKKNNITMPINEPKPIKEKSTKPHKSKDDTNVYLTLYSETKKTISAYIKDKDSDRFKASLKAISGQYIKPLDTKAKEDLKNKLSIALDKKDIASLDKKTLETLQKLVK
ncbi:MAG: hypothetical protein E7351_03675 [Clostridiales bacterium]|nr:hypothetical protein [Clostridiales bacterium]